MDGDGELYARAVAGGGETWGGGFLAAILRREYCSDAARARRGSDSEGRRLEKVHSHAPPGPFASIIGG
eukprot:7451973-Pyramimonas_sp.AAC.1